MCTHVTTYVLDTSVLLSDPWAFTKFAEHPVVLPLVVINELEAKRHHPELGWFARETLRHLEELRVEHGTLHKPVPANNQQGTVRVELNNQNMEVLPSAMREPSGDHRILACALGIEDAVLVTKDIPLRVKAGAVGLPAEDYRAQDVQFSGYSGFVEEPTDPATLPIHCGLKLSDGTLARVGHGGSVRPVPNKEVFGVWGRSDEQRIAIDLLTDEQVGIVSIGGPAGTGKSALALCAGLDAVLEQRTQRRIVVFRPLYAVGGQDLGYLPGSESEKMAPWSQAVYDTLEGIVSDNVIAEVEQRGLLEVLPLTHIRGRSLHDSFVIVDEAQSLERTVLLTVLSRLGRGSRVVLTHDVAQRDNLRVGRHDGIQAVIEKLKGNPLFAHINLRHSERSAIAELVTSMLME
ncbi:PhoH family protein [Corynebacterium sp. 70RC1]|uniref:PhoH family protein n=1 Tax=unclassified Corynebacterium TaxID=2624378 RepID=UPI003593F01E